jgi:hypothetical protein
MRFTISIERQTIVNGIDQQTLMAMKLWPVKMRKNLEINLPGRTMRELLGLLLLRLQCRYPTKSNFPQIKV